MKSQLIAIVAAVVLVGCGESQPPEPPTPKAPDISIWNATEKGNLEAVKQHLAAGVDVNVKNDSGVTPLHRAAYYGHKEIVVLLIAKGADVNVKNDVGYTPLDGNHPDTADLLRKHGGKTSKELKAEGK